MKVGMEQEAFYAIRRYAEVYGKPQGAGFSTGNFGEDTTASAAYYPDAQVPVVLMQVGSDHVSISRYDNPRTVFSVEGKLTAPIQRVLSMHGSGKPR